MLSLLPRTALLVILSVLCLLSSASTYSQTIYLKNGYAHNDYWHKHPLFDALENGYTYVEADIHLNKGKLIVSHLLSMFRKRRTIEKLYLKPLHDLYASGDKNTTIKYPVTLMVDIKTGANETYRALKPLIEKYKDILSTYENGQLIQRQLMIVLSGNKPYDLIKSETNRLVFVDEDLRKVSKDSLYTAMYPIASCKYSKILDWKGKGKMKDSERERLCSYVEKAHSNGTKVRLWASPENEAVWRELLRCGVDLINTDRLTALRKFLIGFETMAGNGGTVNAAYYQ